jgi:hypothetical protein
LDIKYYLLRKADKFLSLFEIQLMVIRKLESKKHFIFESVELNYYFHSYNNFRLTERTIEIPIVGQYLENLKPKNILEIGNVTSYYYDYFRESMPNNHDIVDKYEKGFNVINQDIADYCPNTKYDFIFSISTFEHMDEDRRNERKNLPNEPLSYAIENMKYVVDQMLNPNGAFIITLPLGLSPEFDQAFMKGELKKINCKSIKTYLMIRKTELEWVESLDEIKILPEYPESIIDSMFEGVNHLLVIEIKT